ncbi:MAG: CocE/NonD family hydrolase [Candidatus Helarchaeota archaeon]
MLKYIGSPILRLLGMAPIVDDVIRLPEHLVQTLDCAKLATDVYLPKNIYNDGKVKKAPTLLIRLPYWKNMVSILGYLFASMGYVTILQDCRGTAASNPYGTLAVTFYLRPDGLTTLRWITYQPWYNEKIGMWGISFFGITQLTLSWKNFDMLTCLNPAQCSYTSVLFHQGGLFPLGMAIDVHRLFLTIAYNKDPNLAGFAVFFKENGLSDILYENLLASAYNEPLDSKRALLHIKDLAPIKDPEKLTNILNKTYKVSFNFHEKDDGSLKKFLKEAVLLRKMNLNYRYLPYGFYFPETETDQMKTPILLIAAWADMFVEQVLDDIELIQEKFPDYFKKHFKVVIGPGAHGGMDNIPQLPKLLPDTKRMFGLYQNFFPFWWFDFWLKNNKECRDLSKIPPIRCWIVNKKKWRHFSKWPPQTDELRFYLHSKFGDANSRFGQGKLYHLEQKENEKPDSYEFDPSNPVPTVGGRFLFFSLSGYRNQNKLEERKDILVYTSDKLKKGIEVIGEVKIVFYALSSAEDTDFMVKLVDVHNNRKALNVIDSGVRARFRDGLENPALIEPDKIYKYELRIGRTAWYFKKGHKIRIEISSSNFPRFNVHSNLVGEKTENGYQIATQKIFHDAKHQSYLALPVFKKN